MVDEGVTLVTGTMGAIVPDDRRNAVGLGKFREILEIILLEGLLAGIATVHAAELAQIYWYTFGDEIDIDFFKDLAEIGLIVSCHLP